MDHKPHESENNFTNCTEHCKGKKRFKSKVPDSQ